MYIYLTQNNINGKIYIGQSYKDSTKTKSYYGSGKIIQRSILKNGKSKFTKFILVDNIKTRDELNNLEIFYISLFQSRDKNVGYNISFGGSGGDNYSALSKEAQQLINKKSSHPGKANGMYGNGHLVSGEKNGRYNQNLFDNWLSKMTLQEVNDRMEHYKQTMSKATKKVWLLREKPDMKGDKNFNAITIKIFNDRDVCIDTYTGNLKLAKKKYPAGLIDTYKTNAKYHPKGGNKFWSKNKLKEFDGFYTIKDKK